MGQIIISSRDYKRQLIDLYYGDVKKFVGIEGECGGVFYFALEREVFNAADLCELFEDILLDNNAVLMASPVAYEAVRNLVFVPEREAMVREVEAYFLHNTELCVEGYINFRLKDAECKINDALYALAKRCLKFTVPKVGEVYDN